MGSAFRKKPPPKNRDIWSSLPKETSTKKSRQSDQLSEKHHGKKIATVLAAFGFHIFGHLNFSLCSEFHVRSAADFRFVKTFEDRISNSFLFALSTATGHTSVEKDRYDQSETSNERRSTLYIVETSCRILRIYFRGDSLIAKNFILAKISSYTVWKCCASNCTKPVILLLFSFHLVRMSMSTCAHCESGTRECYRV